MKALVFGAGGQLGKELVGMLDPSSSVPHSEVSITDSQAVQALVSKRRPEVVFNCAAYNTVDLAESRPEFAFAVNSDGPDNIAVACSRYGAQLVHFSTNFVFDGELGRPYVESDKPAPLSEYARSKLEGERRVLERLPDALVVRTAAMFGGPASFPGRILNQARAGRKLRVVSDQRINPTYAKDLAEVAHALATERRTGIVHAVSRECCAWDELARATLDEFGLDVEVESIATGQFPGAAKRPPNGCLSSERIQPLRPWRAALREWAERTKKA